jgi:hypothetical protein
MTQKLLNDLVYVQYNLKLRIKKAQSLALPGPLDLEEIDPYSDWTAEEPDPLFSADDIADLERQAMEGGDGTDFNFTMDDIEDEDDDDYDSEEEALPVPHVGGDRDTSTSRMASGSQSVGMSREEAPFARSHASQSRSSRSRPFPVRGTSSRTRPPISSARTSTAGKRKM